MERNFLYCIICDRCVQVYFWEGFHIVTNPDVPGDICYGPFTSSAPPLFVEPDVTELIAPDADELALMDANAELLASDLEMLV